MEETSIKSIIGYFLSKIYIPILTLILALGSGYGYIHYLQTPMYSSTTQAVLINADAKSTITTSDITLSNNLINTYSEIVKSRSVLSKTIDNLNLNLSKTELKDKITVKTTSSTQLITISVADQDAHEAQRIADGLSKVFKQEIKSIYSIDNIQIVDTADLPETPYNVNEIKQMVYYGLAGVAFGLCIVFILFCLDNTVKDAKSIEDNFNVPVLGSIPIVNKK